MKVEQIYTGCIAHAAYYIESNGEAAIFDPLREVQPYIDKANKDHAKIKYVFETHFHADFVSGHLDLAKKTGATIVYGPTAKPGFDALIADDNQLFKVGDYTIKALHTPGHTMESTTYLLIDEHQNQHGIITGDTLFIGDVGRPDLAQHVIEDLTEEKLAAHLYDSLRNKILPLADHLIVYPNHGAGSACGKMMSKETTDTLGNQKETNYALQDMPKEEFIEKLLEGLTAPPGYFPKNVLMNIQGYDSIDDVIDRGQQPLSPDAFEAAANETGALLLDTREAETFKDAFIPNSINIGLDNNFAMWVGELIPDIKQQILLITDPGKEEESIIRLARVGYDHAIGFLKGGIEAWKLANKEIDQLERIEVSTLLTEQEKGMKVFDIRKKNEYNSQHLIGAENTPLGNLNEYLSTFPKNEKFALHCAGGYRSMIAASMLKQRGWDNFVDVRGGFDEILENEEAKLTEYVCPTSLL